jgi:PAS domain S-box-containing protein
MWRKYLKMPYENNDHDSLRDKIIGLGESSIQKSYYPELQKRLSELERFRALLDLSHDPILLLQIPSWRFTDVTRSASEQLGYSPEKMLEMSLDDLVNPDEMIKIQEIFNNMIENNTSAGKETLLSDFNTSDGHKIPFEISASLVDFSDSLYIVMVLRDITERKVAENKLRASLEEKKVLLREIHHRVKNNMQIISSLLNLQTIYINNEKVVDILKESQNRIKSMAMIHEKLYESSGLTRIGFSDYITHLTTYLFQSYIVDMKRIELKLDVEDILLDIDTAIPCGLIINELVTNSIKHAFDDGKEGSIIIQLHKLNDKLFLSVRDDGVGFPKTLDYKNTETLGLQLINSLVMQLDGTLELKINHGTEFKIMFNEMQYTKRI